MNLLITICARGGSKGIPGKNIQPLNGLPLIAYTIRAAKACAEVHDADIELSTDSPEIRDAARKNGLATMYTRPAALGTDTVGKLPVIQDVLLHCEKDFEKKYDFILDLDVTSPMRTQEDLAEAFSLLQNNKEALNIFSVSPARRHPSFNMVEVESDGFARLVLPPAKQVVARQSAPAVWDLNASFYFYKRSFFDRKELTLVDHSLIYPMKHMCFDLDEPEDFAFLEFLVQQNKLGFSL